MATRSAATASLTGAQALYVLDQALRDRKLTPQDLDRYRKSMDEEIRDLETRLQLLRDASGAHLPIRQPAPRRGRPVGAQNASTRTIPRAAARPRPARPTRSEAEITASQKLQGQYLACISKIALKDRPKYQRIAKKEGREKAIEAMKKALGR
ncbi:MAG TPA: hypothetical protein VGJ81_12510 [Thermoanaerobaculia bacterium]|jgi:hypothetical protein